MRPDEAPPSLQPAPARPAAGDGPRRPLSASPPRGRRGAGRRAPGEVSLERALSKLGAATRSVARRLVREGRVKVEGRVVTDPLAPVEPERARFEIDGREVAAPAALTVALHKPRGVVTTRSDPQGRPTVYGCLAGCAAHLVPVGRLDAATAGLLLLTNDTRLADWLTDPASGVPRVYLVTVRGELTEERARLLTRGVAAPARVARRRWPGQPAPGGEPAVPADRPAPAPRRAPGELLRAAAVTVRKRSRRESHLVLTLTEGRNREVRRMLGALGHEVTALKRVAFGGLQLGDLPPGGWRVVPAAELRAAFPQAPRRGR